MCVFFGCLLEYLEILETLRRLYDASFSHTHTHNLTYTYTDTYTNVRTPTYTLTTGNLRITLMKLQNLVQQFQKVSFEATERKLKEKVRNKKKEGGRETKWEIRTEEL